MGSQPPLVLEVLNDEPQPQLQVIKWCAGHWTELMFALKDRGLGDKIAQDATALNEKFLKGEVDPCWEAHNLINVGALELFGPAKIIDENGGCPVCAFANITQHMADLMAIKHGETH